MIRAIAGIIVGLALTGAAMAQTPPAGAPGGPPPSGFPKMALRAATPAELAAVSITRDVVYGHKDGMALIYDVFRPEKPNGALVVHIVSAGWNSRWIPQEDRVARYQLLLKEGFTVASLHHGSAPRFNAADAAADVQRGLRHIKLHAKDYGVDANRIGVWGASAGGHLALVAGLMADDGDRAASDPVLRQDNRVRAVVAYYPPADLRGRTSPDNRFPALRIDEAAATSVSPILHIDAKDPPTLVLQGEKDPAVTLASVETLKKALDAAGVENKLTVYPGAEHDFFIPGEEAKTDANAVDALKAMTAWFVTHLK